MPGGAPSDGDAPPSVPLSFSNNFWGRDDAGVDPLLTRMQNAKTTCDELKAFYTARGALEEDYAKKLLALCRKPLGSVESGTLRASLDVARGETEAMGKQHALIAQQMKSELEEPLTAFAGGMKERRKIVQGTVEKLLKIKQGQTAAVNRSRDKYEQDCLRIKGYLAQGHMVMGQEERKNKAKLEKTQINMASNSNEYEAAVKVLEETTGRWNKEWKAACDKFQDLEEERLDFTKSSLWAFANIASTVCVSDDASCEKIRLSLENCEVEKDITFFIRGCGTGQEIPDPPRYINFCRGDIDSASEVSEDENYSVAQFSRTINPAFRTSSPAPSATTSVTAHKQQPDSRGVSEERILDHQDETPTPSKNISAKPAPLNWSTPEPNVPPNYSPSQHGDIPRIPHNKFPADGMTMLCRPDNISVTGSALSANTRPSSRDSQSEYSNPSSFTSAEPTSPMKSVPTNGVGLPGMTASPDKTVQKRRSGFFSNSPFRRKSKKEAEPPAHLVQNRNTWNTSQTASPVRMNPTTNNHTATSVNASPTKPPPRQPQLPFNRNPTASTPDGEEAPDPRASFQLNVGNNYFDVASPDSQTTPRASTGTARTTRFVAPLTPKKDDLSMDPIAQALADLKQTSSGVSGMGKPASIRVPVDRYHGVHTPAPDQKPTARPALMSAESQSQMAIQRGTPPPAYDSSAVRSQSALGVPAPAHTKKEMINRSETWGVPPSNFETRQPGMHSTSSTNRDGRRSPAPRAPSPQPQAQYVQRSRSPAPRAIPRAISPSPQSQYRPQERQQQAPPPQQFQNRARSPGPAMMRQTPSHQGSSPSMNPYQRSASPNPYGSASGRPRGQSQSQPRAPYQPPPPQQQQQQPDRPGTGMEMQLSSHDVTRYNDGGSGRSRQGMMRPTSSYGGPDQYQQGAGGGGYDERGGLRRERSKSLANVPMMANGNRPGGGSGGPSKPLYYARAMYSYTAAIPEELGFSKGDILAVLRLQDDGWHEASVSQSGKGTRIGSTGLVPSNYLQRC